ncbi:hypothetical protein BN110_017 [Yersinia phage phiR8-01]|uniref:Uncharacterized protein n=1 Tax=Yersinia phage phiR8-01 TaxID=1206556 RepID=I7LEA1_9CAUD|nr:hypothetical protein HOT05_gp06 [Yersinia phage phiR8-01]CCI88387.2 hypothetical protein BN110_017 [Yersinia phage phiR8-01]
MKRANVGQRGAVFYKLDEAGKMLPYIIQVNACVFGPFATTEEAQRALDSHNDPANHAPHPVLSVEIRKVKLNEDEQGNTDCGS